MLSSVLHFSFTVSDIEASIAWYTEVLGLELVHRQRQDNEYTRRLVGFDDAVLEIAQFKLPGERPPVSTHMLELVEYVQPKGAPARGLIPTNDVGAGHLAFIVDDAGAEHDRLESLGVVFRGDPVDIVAGANRGGRVCYFEDPDGITLEIIQLPARKEAA